MRISTGMIFNSGVSSMQQRTSSLLRTQQQVSSGRRILTPSDDPVAAARALEVTQSQTINKQYQTSQENAKSALGIMDGQLSSMNDLLARMRELTVQAGNAALSVMDRRSIATEMRARFDELVALANSTDGTGQYVFSGYQGTTKPFAGSVDNGVDYLGDDGVRTLQVSGARHLPISASGNDAFMRIKNGNGVFVTGIQNEKSTNASHITFEGNASTTNPPATIGSFEMRFWTDTAGTVKTSAQAVGSVSLSAVSPLSPLTFTTGVDNPINITLDGVLPAISVDLDTTGVGTTYDSADEIAAAIQAAIDAASASPGARATVSVDTVGQLVITDASKGAPASTIALADAGGGGNDSFGALFGTPDISNGANGAPGTTYFDLVNANGVSLYAHTPSAAGGADNTYTHPYASGTPQDLSSAGPFAFDFGMSPVFTGIPADGDSFSIDRTNAAATVTGKTFTASAARAVATASAVTNPVKWSQASNSGNLELRFWTDPVGGTTTAGSATGLPFNTDIVLGVNDTFDLDLDGAGAPIAVQVAAATYTSPAALAGAVQTAIDTATGSPPGPSLATVTLTATNQLVVTSNTIGPPSAVALTENNAGFATIFGGSATATPSGATPFGSATGAPPLFTVAAGVNDQFALSVNNGPSVIVNAIPAGNYSPPVLAGLIQAAIDGTAGLGPGLATVTLDAATGKLLVTSDVAGAGSSIGLGVAPPGNTGFSTMFSGATSVAGGAVGGVQTPAYAVAAAAPTYPVVIPAAPDNDFLLSIDNMSGGGVPIALAPGAIYLTPATLKADVQNAVDAALGFGKATVSLDASDRLVIASNLKGPTSQVTVGATAGTGFAQLFGGAAASTAGTISTVGATFYDLVDVETGNSLYTGGTSTTGATAAGGTYTHVFSSGAPISLSSPLSPAFDFGATVTVTGIPAGGDAFTIKSNTDPVVGNGYFAVAPKTAAAANMGSGIIGTGEVLDPAKWNSPYNSRRLEVRFWTDPADISPNPPVYYDLVDTATEKSLFTDSASTSGGSGNTYTHVFKSGDAILFSNLAAPYNDFGTSVTINGTPASGDVFTLNDSTTQSIFDTLSDLIHAIESPVGPVGSTSNAELHNKLGAALTSIGAAADNFSRVRADVGTRLGEIDDLGSVSSNLELQYASTLSNLQDIDYSKAITDLMRMQMELQAAQQSFTKVSQLSLFNYL